MGHINRSILLKKAVLDANKNTALSAHPNCPRGNYQNSPGLLGFLIFLLYTLKAIFLELGKSQLSQEAISAESLVVKVYACLPSVDLKFISSRDYCLRQDAAAPAIELYSSAKSA